MGILRTWAQQCWRKVTFLRYFWEKYAKPKENLFSRYRIPKLNVWKKPREEKKSKFWAIFWKGSFFRGKIKPASLLFDKKTKILSHLLWNVTILSSSWCSLEPKCIRKARQRMIFVFWFARINTRYLRYLYLRNNPCKSHNFRWSDLMHPPAWEGSALHARVPGLFRHFWSV